MLTVQVGVYKQVEYLSVWESERRCFLGCAFHLISRLHLGDSIFFPLVCIIMKVMKIKEETLFCDLSLQIFLKTLGK